MAGTSLAGSQGIELMLIGFDSANLEPDDSEDVERFNAALVRLKERRKEKIVVEGPFSESKLAWKIATYQQSILYRIVMLAAGCALNWNLKNTLCRFLAARALLETIAVLWDFERQITSLSEKADFGGIDKLVTNRIFSTRDEEWFKETPETEAVNVLTLVDKLDTQLLHGMRRHYDFLSERCHPNSLGHHMFFGTLDTGTGTTTYSDQKNVQMNLDHILGGAMLIEFAEKTIDRLDQVILQVARSHGEATK
jgi:hypothetical protein